MTQIKINIPDDKLAGVVAAFVKMYDYQNTVEGPDGGQIPNPESKPNFAKRQVAQFIKDVYIASKVNVDVDAVKAAATTAAKADMVNVGAE
jgi:hypothetical protein